MSNGSTLDGFTFKYTPTISSFSFCNSDIFLINFKNVDFASHPGYILSKYRLSK